jgi:glycogenin glucosyltransferase
MSNKNNIYLEILPKPKSELTQSTVSNEQNKQLKRYAYVAYMANDRDIKGVLLLHYNLKKVNSKYPFVVLIIEKVSDSIKKILKENNIPTIYCNMKSTLESFTNDNEYIDIIMNKHYYGKYLIFALNQFEKVVYLDTDLLLMENIDNLFDYDTKPTQKDVTSLSRIYMTNDMQASAQSDNKVYVVLTTNAFNSGVIIYEPNDNITKILFRELVNLGKEGFKKINTDQDLLNKLISANILECSLLSMVYNCSPTVVSDFLRLNMIDRPRVIHFMLKPKPWELIDGTTEPIVFSNQISKHLYGLWVNTYFEMLNNRYFEIAPGSDRYSDNYHWGEYTVQGCTLGEKIIKL